jgi:hypothetical protein
MGMAWSFPLCRTAAPGGRAFGQAAGDLAAASDYVDSASKRRALPPVIVVISCKPDQDDIHHPDLEDDVCHPECQGHPSAGPGQEIDTWAARKQIKPLVMSGS